ncbi:MAG: hypothetical protein IT377_03830 [Polyangiaceae bacterium]|nr:hypothetical protein [Polyangiaceae bacterium]
MNDRRKGKTNTMPMPGVEATHVGAAPPGWEVETTTVGTPPGWEVNTSPDETVPPDWEVERTVEELSPQGPKKRRTSRPPAEKTHIGPPPNFDLAPGRDVSAPEPSSPVASPRVQRPPVEVEVRKLSPTAARRAPPAYEIWTKNRVYALDATLVCCDVIDLATGQSDTKHPFLGGQLVGGQRRVNDNNELTFPLPTPGSDAVFQTLDASRRPRLVVTSKVTRVILHVQVVRVDERQKDDTWGAIASTRRPVT